MNIITVRDLVSGTHHTKYGLLMRGFIRDIEEKYYSPLFEKIPQGPEDMDVMIRENKGKPLTPERIANIKKLMFEKWNKKYKKQYELEHKLAVARKMGGRV